MMVNKSENMLAYGAHSAREGLDIWNDHEFDAILLDINMPGMSGLEALKYIRLRDENIPVVMCTAQTSHLDIQEAFDRGADDYVVKPIQKEILWNTLKRVLTISQQLSIGEERDQKRTENMEVVLAKVSGMGVHLKERFRVVFRANQGGAPAGQKFFGEGVALDATGFRLQTKHSLDGIDSITFAIDRQNGFSSMLVGIGKINHTGFEGKESIYRLKFVSVRKTS